MAEYISNSFSCKKPGTLLLSGISNLVNLNKKKDDDSDNCDDCMISLRTERNEPSSRNEYFRVVFKIDTAIEAGTNLKLTIYKVPTLKD